jgi:hypothetical protein
MSAESNNPGPKSWPEILHEFLLNKPYKKVIVLIVALAIIIFYRREIERKIFGKDGVGTSHPDTSAVHKKDTGLNKSAVTTKTSTYKPANTGKAREIPRKAQHIITVNGSVSDEKGKSLDGVVVRLNNASAFTNGGFYQLTVPANNTGSVNVSFEKHGYKSHTVPAPLNIQRDTTSLHFDVRLKKQENDQEDL